MTSALAEKVQTLQSKMKEESADSQFCVPNGFLTDLQRRKKKKNWCHNVVSQLGWELVWRSDEFNDSCRLVTQKLSPCL